MNSNGFLLYDSIISIMVFLVIIMLMPAFLTLTKLDKASEEKLYVYRNVYIKSFYMNEDELIKYSKVKFANQSFTCDSKLGDLCP